MNYCNNCIYLFLIGGKGQHGTPGWDRNSRETWTSWNHWTKRLKRNYWTSGMQIKKLIKNVLWSDGNFLSPQPNWMYNKVDYFGLGCVGGFNSLIFTSWNWNTKTFEKLYPQEVIQGSVNYTKHARLITSCRICKFAIWLDFLTSMYPCFQQDKAFQRIILSL